jgi:hypothetical protein
MKADDWFYSSNYGPRAGKKFLLSVCQHAFHPTVSMKTLAWALQYSQYEAQFSFYHQLLYHEYECDVILGLARRRTCTLQDYTLLCICNIGRNIGKNHAVGA